MMNIFKNLKKKNILPIRTYGDPVLKKTAVKIENIDDSIIELADSMMDTMWEADGVGLAAPQIGKSIRLIVLGIPYNEEKIPPTSPGELQLLPQMPLALVNPEVTPTTERLVCSEEGCLSVPKIYAKVTRPESVMLSADLLSGHHINVECSGFLARALQHEIDHLNGILFPDIIDDNEFESIKSSLDSLTQKK